MQQSNGKKPSFFNWFAKGASRWTGHPWAFLTAVAIIAAWALSGPMFGYSDTWQLVINTGTTIITFLMVFLIQSTQNRDGAAIQIKLDELIRALQGAHNRMINLEDMEEEELEKLRERYTKLADAARIALEQGDRDEDCPELEDSKVGQPAMQVKN